VATLTLTPLKKGDFLMYFLLTKIKDSEFERIEKEIKAGHTAKVFDDNFWHDFLAYCEDAINEQGGIPFYEIKSADSATGRTREMSFSLSDFEYNTIKGD
tara:strand:- start:14621 stop:14920 length:300 start_codon:yes stop_codon:yes gene_type:complete